MRNRVWLVGVTLILVALGLSACGKRGTLEPPPSTTVEPAAAETDGKTAEKAHKPFILDGLL